MADARVDISDVNPCTWEGIATLRNRAEKIAASEGLAGVDLFFRGQGLFMDALSRFPTLKEKQRANPERVVKAAPDPLVVALRAIAAGHNDARGLAQSVLAALKEKRDD